MYDPRHVGHRKYQSGPRDIITVAHVLVQSIHVEVVLLGEQSLFWMLR